MAKVTRRRKKITPTSNVNESEPKLPFDTTRKFKTECFVVGVDSFFLAMGRWTELPSYAKKYGDPGKAAQDVEDLKLAHPSSNVRVLKVKSAWKVEEVV